MSNTLRYNNTIPGNIYYGGAAVQNVYYNNTKVWSAIPLSGTLAVGNLITFDNKTWRVFHNTGNQWYLALSNIVENIQFGRNDVYSGSTLANRCASYLNNFSASAQSFMQNVTVNGVTAKVFVPSFEQVIGGFSYYNSEASRICQLNGKNSWWWTSSAYGVSTEGTLGRITSTTRLGFRPHICITF